MRRRMPKSEGVIQLLSRTLKNAVKIKINCWNSWNGYATYRYVNTST